MSQQELRKIQSPIAIPEPTNQVDALWRTCMALKEAVEVLQGLRGNRAAALKVELDNLGDEINNTGGGGGGAGVDTFFELLDTDLSGQAVNHLVYNADGTNWFPTGNNFRWFPTSSEKGTGSVFLGTNFTIDWNTVEVGPVSFAVYNGTEFEIGSEFFTTKVLGGSSGVGIKAAGTGTLLDIATFNTTATFLNTLSPLSLRDRDNIFRDAGYATMKLISPTPGTVNVPREYWHSRIHCTGTTTLDFSGTTHGGIQEGAVTWVLADGGDVTVQGSAGFTVRKFLGSGGPSNGSATVADGGWATVVKHSNSFIHIVGVGVT